MTNSKLEIGSFNAEIINHSPIKGIFGILLYSKSNPYMLKVLRDKDFWNTLDENSGKLFPIFSIRPKDGEYEKHNNDEPSFGYFIPVWKEPKENLILLQELGIADTKSLPIFLIYTEIEGQQYYSAYKINGEDIDSTFKSINDFCIIVAETIENFDTKNLINNESIYREVTGNIEYLVSWQKDSFLRIFAFMKLKAIKIF